MHVVCFLLDHKKRVFMSLSLFGCWALLYPEQPTASSDEEAISKVFSGFRLFSPR